MIRLAILITLAAACDAPPAGTFWALESGRQSFASPCEGPEEADPGLPLRIHEDAGGAAVALSECVWLLDRDGDRLRAPEGQMCVYDAEIGLGLVELLELEVTVADVELQLERTHRTTLPSGLRCTVTSSYRFEPL